MTEYCKHGQDMASTCRKCGRVKVVEVPDFAAKKNSFTSSIGRLEDTVRRMNVELSSGPVSRPTPWAPPSAASPAPATGEEEADTAPPPPPVEKFPWQRR